GADEESPAYLDCRAHATKGALGWALAGGALGLVATATAIGNVTARGGVVRFNFPYGSLLLPLGQTVGALAGYGLGTLLVRPCPDPPSDAARAAWSDRLNAKLRRERWWLAGCVIGGGLAGALVDSLRPRDRGWFTAGLVLGTLTWQALAARSGVDCASP
ncbi:MAG: hypothetical protein AAB368_08895, partial [bacterium]